MRHLCLLPILLFARTALGQSDPLVSKTVPFLLADRGQLWAFAGDGLKYSRIDLFPSPVAVRNGVLPFRAGISGGVGRAASLMLFLRYRPSDSVSVSGVAGLGRDGSTDFDSLLFQRSKARNNAVTSGVELSALALWRDTVVLGGGNAGIALARAGAEGEALASDTLSFQALLSGGDTLLPALDCPVGKSCRVDTLAGLVEAAGPVDSVTALAVDSSAADSIWLLIGTPAGLRRGLLGGSFFPRVPLDSGDSRIRVEGMHVDPQSRILWVFSGSHYFFSDDHGRSFRLPPDLPVPATKPSSLKAFNPAPEAANLGDTSFINFNLDHPGLVLFRRDTLLANRGDGFPFDALLDAEDGLDISRGQAQLGSLAVVRSGGESAVAVGSTGKGLFYRLFGPGRADEWVNLNSLKRLKGSLEEVITFPTLFTGGQSQPVRLGYRLKKNGNVTITVYNYAMEKVKTLVRDAPRLGGGSRSEKPEEDLWDGLDRSGRPVSVGTYYILVESDQGEKGWGKAISVRGRN